MDKCLDNDTKAKLIKSMVISYLYISITRKIIVPGLNKLICCKISSEYDSISFNVILILLSIVMPYVVYKILFKDMRIGNVARKLGIDVVIEQNEIDILETRYDGALYMQIYLKDSSIAYEGYLTERELEDGSTKFFCLSKYKKLIRGKNGKFKCVKNCSKDEQEKVLIYFDQISHFEVINKE